MADETVVTELIIDARGAEVGSAAYVKAMKAAQAAADRAIDSANDVAKAVEAQSTVMSSSAGSITSTAKAWERLKASADPAYRATRDMERAMITADAAARKLGIDEVERARVLDLVRQKTDAVSASTRAGVTHIASVGTAAKLTSNQMLNLSRQGNDVITMFALGAAPMQIFASQAGQVFDALQTGPAGALGSLKAIGAGLLSFVSTPLGGIVAAAGLAAGAIATYALATREDIKSADEVLEAHKKLLNDIANSYPHLTEELKKYQNEAAKLPGSVIAANLGDRLADAQATLAAQQADIASQIRLATTNPLTGDRGDFSNFGDKAYATLRQIEAGLDGTAAGALRAQDQLGKLRIDPSVPKDAHDFASGLQDTADKAAEMAAKINSEKGIKSIVVDGQKATKTLAEVSAGFKDVKGNASTADATIANLFGTINGAGSDGFGVTRSLGGTVQGVVGQFEQAGQAIQNMRREQAQSMLDLTKQFRDTTTQVETLKEAIDTAGAKENIEAFFGDVSNIDGANAALSSTVGIINKLFDALNSGNTTASTVASGIDMLRQTLVQGGLGVEQVNRFIDSLVRARMQMDAGMADAAQLNRAIQAIQNRTVTITVVTRQVGTGTQSTYDVPNQTGGTSGVGVTRYSSNGPEISKTPIFNTSTNSWGYTQPKTYQDPYILSLVNAKYPQRAAGGPISANSPYWVGEKGPELVLPQSAATVIPNAQSMALATSSQSTADQDKLTAAITDTAVNTKKTAQLLDDIKTSSGGSGIGGGSSGGGASSSSGNVDDKAAMYMKVLATWRSNFAAAGVVGSGNIGYGAQGLGATPEKIAHRIVYGFSTGGMIGGDSRDTQRVEMFKRPSEKIIIADSDQISDQRGGSRSGGQRPINVNNYITVPGGGSISKESLADLRRQTEAATRDALRSVNGR